MRVTLCAAVMSGTMGLADGESASADNKRPNIVYLMSDDQALYSLGCYGTPDVQTPNIDALARDGMVFDNHYDTTAICMASRANVMTGMLEYKTGTNFGHGAMVQSKWDKAYPKLLREAGYVTAFAGKFGFEVSRGPGMKGILPEDDFDKWGGGPGQTNFDTAKNRSMKAYAAKYPHATRSYGAFGADFIEEASHSDKPFCLSISFKAPHRPVQPDPLYDHVYAGKTFQKPANYGRQHGLHFAEQSRLGRQYTRFEEWNYDTDYDQVMGQYHQLIYAIDVAVGMVRTALKKHGVADNTIVIYTSDNGYMCGSHGYGSKVVPYEESSRVPLIMFDPRHTNSGQELRTKALTGNIDFAPTMLELAGLPIPENMDGRSLLPIYDNPEADIRETLPLINVWGPVAVQSFAILTKSHKYIYWPYAEGDLQASEEMYDTSRDAGELTNLVSSGGQEKQLMEMRRHYDTAIDHWKAETVDFHDYKKYGTIFDRHVDWETKRPLHGNKRGNQK